MSLEQLRIFISSPGDVQDERAAALQVIADLNKRYTGVVELEPVVWEDMPLQADGSFQANIDELVGAIDIAVFILWSRLGSEVADIHKADGSHYKSGTEREWELMRQAREASPDEDRRPDLLVYTRSDEAERKRRLAEAAAEEEGDLVSQKQALDSFIS